MAEQLFAKLARQKDTFTENGAISNSSMGDEFADQFAHASSYKGRNLEDVFTDQAKLWNSDAETSMRFIFYLRLVTRKVKLNKDFVTEKVQCGQGLRDEAFKRLLWVAQYHGDAFYRNIWLLPIIGSWKDLWTLLFYDITLGNEVIKRDVIYTLLVQGLSMEEHSQLVKKFIPRIVSSKKAITPWKKTSNQLAKEFAKFMGMTPQEYNKNKASGTAHDFQKLMCGRLYDQIQWGKIPGRALNRIVNSKFLTNHNLVESYSEWIKTQPIAKFTGYVYELGHQVVEHGYHMPLYQSITIDKQYEGLVATAKENGHFSENVLCALDTSGSMSRKVGVEGSDISALDVCKSLGIFFADMNVGAFHNVVTSFENECNLITLNGSFTEKFKQLPECAMGGTNFQSVIELMKRVRKDNPTLPLEEFPTTLLVVSDMQFNPTENLTFDTKEYRWIHQETNHEAAVASLKEVFPSEWVDNFKFIWWNVCNYANDYPTTMDDGGTYIMSGFDGSILNLMLGEGKTETDKPKVVKTMAEALSTALSQEILLQVSTK